MTTHIRYFDIHANLTPLMSSCFPVHILLFRMMTTKVISFRQDQGIHVILGMFPFDTSARKMFCEVRGVKAIKTIFHGRTGTSITDGG